MKCVIFCHAVSSCWNNGNAHFLRGVARELTMLGHAVTIYEPLNGWSRQNALQDGGAAALAEAERLLPGVDVWRYADGTPDLDRALDGADLVLVHEWNEPELIAAVGRARIRGGHFILLFHDTHHRAVTAPHELERFDLDGYDGVLAFGEVLREIYLRRGWSRRAFTWHEAADTALFRPSPDTPKERDLVWIGNWGDGERTEELKRFLIEPSAALGITTRVHGVRYPADARGLLAARNIEFAGWLPNHRAPDALARARATVHVPRGPYTQALPGIPTIRVFEALACGTPLVSAPWSDAENLFPPGAFLWASTQDEMTAALALVLRDRDAAAELTRTGLDAVLARHTCRHRAEELVAIADRLGAPAPRAPARRSEEAALS